MRKHFCHHGSGLIAYIYAKAGARTTAGAEALATAGLRKVQPAQKSASPADHRATAA